MYENDIDFYSGSHAMNPDESTGSGYQQETEERYCRIGHRFH